MSNIKNKKYYKYQLTYPIEGNKIYKSRSLRKVVGKCLKDYKKNYFNENGIFHITNLDRDVEYRFKIKKNKIYSIKNLKGGEPLKEEVAEISGIDAEPQIAENPEIEKTQKQLELANFKLDNMSEFEKKRFNDISQQIADLEMKNEPEKKIIKEEIIEEIIKEKPEEKPEEKVIIEKILEEKHEQIGPKVVDLKPNKEIIEEIIKKEIIKKPQVEEIIKIKPEEEKVKEEIIEEIIEKKPGEIIKEKIIERKPEEIKEEIIEIIKTEPRTQTLVDVFDGFNEGDVLGFKNGNVYEWNLRKLNSLETLNKLGKNEDCCILY